MKWKKSMLDQISHCTITLDPKQRSLYILKPDWQMIWKFCIMKSFINRQKCNVWIFQRSFFLKSSSYISVRPCTAVLYLNPLLFYMTLNLAWYQSWSGKSNKHKISKIGSLFWENGPCYPNFGPKAT